MEMIGKNDFRLTLGESRAVTAPRQRERRAPPRAPKLELDPRRVARVLKATPGYAEVAEQVPNLGKWQLWWPLPVASFTVCQKTGTATWLDIWDADHFDGFTDMQRCVSDCRAWFSADGYAFWGSPETKTGRINCYFRAPTTGAYVCYAQLQSFGGPAQVECRIDNSSFGPLPFNGSISQPHTRTLAAGYHSFRIWQMSGSFFFVGLTVWRV
jgi:hypothetical protein